MENMKKKVVNENKLQEDLGTFGGAVKNGWLKDNFAVEKVTVERDEKGIHLRCKMGRWFGTDDDIKLYPDGTGVNLDPKASDQQFQWKTIRARTTSFSKAILIGAGLGVAAGSLTPGALGTAGLIGAGMYGSYKAGQSSANNQQSTTVNEESINEVAPQLIGAGVGALVGGIGGGLYALYKNRDDVIYYADGSYKSIKGTVSGRWDGSVEEQQQSERQKPQTVQIPGMPSDFPRNPENVKIAQQYVIALGANLSTSKSASGVDGMFGPRTRKAILGAMKKRNLTWEAFWKEAQEYAATKQNVNNLKKQNLQNIANQANNMHINNPSQQVQQQAVNEIKSAFNSWMERINNATILQ